MAGTAYAPLSPDLEGEKLLQHEDNAAEISPAQRPQSSVRAAALLWWMSYAALWAAVIFLSIVLYTSRASTGVAEDINRIVPSFSQHVVTFRPDEKYVGDVTSKSFKNDTQHLWLSLVPKGLGFVEIKNPERYPALASPYIKYDKTVYTTSVTHQLHCLYMIMHGFNDLALKGSLKMDMNDDDEGLTREGEDPADHLSHCFDYLRQAIMCHGDTALEGLQTTFGPDVGGSDGWNTKHVCKRYDQVYDWLETHRIDDRIWI